MARMRRIQIVIDPELDDRLQQEAAAVGMSKSAVIRASLREHLGLPFDNGLWSLPTFDAEPVEDIDTELYGPINPEVWPS
jgi:hypothetical protein